MFTNLRTEALANPEIYNKKLTEVHQQITILTKNLEATEKVAALALTHFRETYKTYYVSLGCGGPLFEKTEKAGYEQQKAKKEAVLAKLRLKMAELTETKTQAVIDNDSAKFTQAEQELSTIQWEEPKLTSEITKIEAEIATKYPKRGVKRPADQL